MLTTVNGSPFPQVTGSQEQIAPMQEQMQEQIESLKQAQIASMEALVETAETLKTQIVTQIARLKGR